MAFDYTNFWSVSPAGARMFIYHGGADNVAAANYFNDIAANLRVNDVIMNVPSAGTPVLYSVTDITAGVVTIA